MSEAGFNIVPNRVAAEYIKGRVAMSPGAFGGLPDALKMRAFTVARIEDVGVLANIRDVVAKLPEGGDWKGLRDEVARKIADASGSDKGSQARAELVMRVNGMAAYAVARHADQKASADVFPYWMYMCNLDGHERDSHARLNGVVLRHDDPFWDRHYPPWEWGCRCYITKLTEEDAADYGVADAGSIPVSNGDGFRFDPNSLSIDLNSIIDGLAPQDREFARLLFGQTRVPLGNGYTQSVFDFNEAQEPVAKKKEDLRELPVAEAIQKARGEDIGVALRELTVSAKTPHQLRGMLNELLALKGSEGVAFATGSVSKSLRDVMGRVTEYMKGIMHKDVFPKGKKIDATYTTGRAYAIKGNDSIFFNARTRDPAADAIHEAMHWLEHNNAHVNKRCIEFREYRTKGETATSLRKQTGLKYGSHEVGKPDKFFDAYCGRVYPKVPGMDYESNEILSMGVQRIFSKPLAFYLEDREYFDFCIQLLRGEI